LPNIFCFFQFIYGCNEATLKKPDVEIINRIVIEDYRKPGGGSPELIFSGYKTQIDTNYHWLFNIKVSAKSLNNLKTRSLKFSNYNVVTDSSAKFSFHLDIYYANTNKMETIGIPLEKGVDYFNLLIKIFEENKIKDLEIAVKKLNYMKD
jgi:hypothetical protein